MRYEQLGKDFRLLEKYNILSVLNDFENAFNRVEKNTIQITVTFRKTVN